MGLQTVIAFTAVRFQGVLASFFLNALFFSHFVEGFGVRESFPKALSNSFDLGPHSDIVLFESLPLISCCPSLERAHPATWWVGHGM